jgi:hypothetical protein
MGKVRDYGDCLVDVIDIIIAEHDRLMAEHQATPPGLFGRPRLRHYEILEASRALKRVSREVKALALRAKEETR